MRCTNSKGIKLLSLLICFSLLATGCSFTKSEASDSYNFEASSVGSKQTKGTNGFFGSELCVTDDVNFGTEQVNSQNSEGAGVFNVTENEVTYNKNIYKKLYPASTTKILTAYIIIKNCNLNDMTTVSENAVKQGADSSVCHLKAGDKVSIKTLLYGMMLESGNDAAIALSEYYAGTPSDFAKIMNQTAASLGATHTHFVNPNGLPSDDHYTTVYDMYLMFNAAIKLDTFVDIISTKEYQATYISASGQETNQLWKNTNYYLNGHADTPDGFKVIGGKTGTTDAAGYCLVLYSKNSNDDDIISIVYKGNNKSNLYSLMTQMLTEFGN
ncbi:D-alanyl-D-alanine carboxypeptidase (penicillin-binding protein 5/6) [Lachnospiraceae bacterium C7]|nr:D-alanyl-D-alanine carboxypeptidase (penicillin-binding protein 5/6) [Lachnospiraceae bacterium C7]